MPRIGARRLEGGEHALELAHDQHMPQNLAQRGIAARAFLGEWRLVGVDRHVRERQMVGAAKRDGIDVQALWHEAIAGL